MSANSLGVMELPGAVRREVLIANSARGKEIKTMMKGHSRSAVNARVRELWPELALNPEPPALRTAATVEPVTLEPEEARNLSWKDYPRANQRGGEIVGNSLKNPVTDVIPPTHPLYAIVSPLIQRTDAETFVAIEDFPKLCDLAYQATMDDHGGRGVWIPPRIATMLVNFGLARGYKDYELVGSLRKVDRDKMREVRAAREVSYAWIAERFVSFGFRGSASMFSRWETDTTTFPPFGERLDLLALILDVEPEVLMINGKPVPEGLVALDAPKTAPEAPIAPPIPTVAETIQQNLQAQGFAVSEASAPAAEPQVLALPTRLPTDPRAMASMFLDLAANLDAADAIRHERDALLAQVKDLQEAVKLANSRTDNYRMRLASIRSLVGKEDEA